MTWESEFNEPIYLSGCPASNWTSESYHLLKRIVNERTSGPAIELIFMAEVPEEEDIASYLHALASVAKPEKECYQVLITEKPLQHEQVIIMQNHVQALISSDYVRTHTYIVAEAIEKRAEYLEPEIIIKMVRILENEREKRKPIQRLILDQRKANDIFSAGEMEIIQAILDGRKNTQICEDIYKAKSTVYSILSKILQKLEVENRTQIISECIKRQWLISVR